MSLVDELRPFTSATDEEGEERLNRIWSVEPWVMATDGTSIAAIRVVAGTSVPDLAKDFPQFAAECRSYIEREASMASTLAIEVVREWAGEYNADEGADGKMRTGTVWGIPFDRNKVAKALQYLFAGVTGEIAVDVVATDDAAEPSVATTTRCGLNIHAGTRVYLLARARDEQGTPKELQPIGDMIENGEAAFDAVLEKL